MEGMKKVGVALLVTLALLLMHPHAHAAYVDNHDGTVTNTTNGLIWQQADDGNGRYWEQALAYCEGLGLAGHSDWRLPNYRELASLVDYSRYNPSIDPVFSCRSNDYWSSSTLAYLPGYAWYVYFHYGYVYWYYKTNGSLLVRCVRGGPSGSFGSLVIAQTPMSGPPGTTFVQWGTGFSANSTAILHFQKPDGTEYPPQNVQIDSSGHFEVTYSTPLSKPLGTYTWWGIDGPTGNKSNAVSYVIERTSDYFSFSAVSSPQAVGAPFSLTLDARHANGAFDQSFNGEVALGASLGVASPARATLVNGTVTLDQVTLDSAGLGVKLIAGGQGRYGESDPFDVAGSSQTAAYVFGTVTGIDQAAVSGAEVSVGYGNVVCGTASSDSNGKYAISGLSPGQYDILARAYGGRVSTISTVNLANNQPFKADLLVQGSDDNPTGLTPILFVPGAMGSSIGYGVIYARLPEKPPEWNDKWDTESWGLHDPNRWAGWRDLKDAFHSADQHYNIGSTLFPVPYDWRMDLDSAARKYLKPWIDEAKRVAGTQKVNIIAHSMGGLLVRAYIQSGDYGNDIDKFAMVGTPNHGSSFPYFIWEGGDPIMADNVKILHSNIKGAMESWISHFYEGSMEAEFLTRYSFPLPPPSSLIPGSESLYRHEMHKLAHGHVPSISQVLPTYSFLIDNGSLQCEPNQWLIDLNNSQNMSRMGKEDDTSKIRTKIFMGKDTPTLTKIFVGPRICWLPGFYQDGTPLSSFMTGESNSGDGTVPTSSASLGSLVTVVSRPGEHAGLIGTFKDGNDGLVAFMKGGAAAALSTSASPAAVPVPKELTVAILGRAQPYLTDPQGRKSGVNPAVMGVEEGIPGTILSMNGTGMNITIQNPADGVYTLKLKDAYTEDYQVTFSYSDKVKNVRQSYWIYSRQGIVTIPFRVNSLSSSKIKVNYRPTAASELKASPVTSPAGLSTRFCWTASPDASVVSYNLYSRGEDEPHLSLAANVHGTCYDTTDPWASDSTIKTRLYALSAVSKTGSKSFLSNAEKNNDRDHDGLSDEEELKLGTDMNNPDSDGDGLGDGEELLRGTDALKKDTDGDGYSDFEEIQAGSDPRSATSIPVPLIADFTAKTTSGAAPLAVAFTNTSTGDIASYRWRFGDGGASILKSPTHIYRKTGTYTVTLTVQGVGGSKTVTRTGYIQVN